MYLGPKPQRRSPRLALLLLILIAAVASFDYYLWTFQPRWTRPFEPTPTPTRTAQSYVLEAEAYYGQGQLDAAIAAYQQAVSITPDDVQAHIRLAQLLALRQRSAEAVLWASQAVLLEPSNPRALATLCQALDAEGRYAQAFDACECAIELDPNYAEAYAYLARAYVDTGDWVQARQYAQKAVDLDYQSMIAHFSQGYVLEAQGRYKQAAQAYENAIVLHPRLALLYIGAGQNHRVLGQFTKAIDRFERATRLDPGNPVGYDELGWTYYTAGQYSRAIDTLEQATLIDPEHTTSWGHLGIAYYVLQQYEQVIPALEQAIRLAERDYLRRARRVIVLGQQVNRQPAQSVEVLGGDFPPTRGPDSLWSAELRPVFTRDRLVAKPDQTCGDLVAFRLGEAATAPPSANRPETATSRDNLQANPTLTPPSPFLNASGLARLDLDQGWLELELNGVPQPEGIPYEAQVLLWPDEKLSVGYLQPDATGRASLSFTFKDIRSAPVDYYTLLGFSYVFLGQCDQGVPRLLDSVEVDPNPSNPAWQGLADCPEKPADTGQ